MSIKITKKPTGGGDTGDLAAHTGNTSNPHSVTKTQVGLANVDNTSDVNKPVSTAQQTALNLKLDASAALTTEQLQDIIGAMVSGNTQTNITVTYDDTNGKLDFVVTGGGLTQPQVMARSLGA